MPQRKARVRKSSGPARTLATLLFLVEKYRRGDASGREKIHRAYLSNTRYINNWDLADASAQYQRQT
jgi:hypothetical protein